MEYFQTFLNLRVSKTIGFSQFFPRKAEFYDGGILINLQIQTISSKGSPATLNIPTPTPAPDRGGPVACLGGPIASKARLGLQLTQFPRDSRLVSRIFQMSQLSPFFPALTTRF